jgi:hypothetical protein
MSAAKIRDMAPEIRAAGKLTPRGGGAKECIISPEPRPLTPERVRKFQAATRPSPGEKRILHSFAGDPPPDPIIRHGVVTRTSLEASDLVNPAPKTLYQHNVLHQQEQIYRSHLKAPLGASHDQVPGLPPGTSLTDTTFGRKGVKEDSAADAVSPCKTREEVEAEAVEGRELYRKSHNAWDVGEMVDRDYDWTVFTKDSLYGVPTPHDNSGSQARDSLHWLSLDQSSKKTPIVTKRVDDFRERTQPQLGEVHDPIADTLKVDKDHSFGVSVLPDNFSAGELMHIQGDTVYSQCQGYDPGIMTTIRHRLKNSHFTNFPQLLHALSFTDKNSTGLLSAEKVCETCFQYNLPLTADQLSLLVRWCRSEEGEGATLEGGVRYRDLLEMINWQHEIPTELETRVQQGNTPAGSGVPETTSPATLSEYRSSSEVVQVVGGAPPDHTHHTLGVPTIRSDLPAPRIKRVGDSKNYGDESDAYGLMYPSIYSSREVFERDFFRSRGPQEVREVFQRVGVEMPDQVFQEVWQEAERRDPRGEVSIESFRAVLEEVQEQPPSHVISST